MDCDECKRLCDAHSVVAEQISDSLRYIIAGLYGDEQISAAKVALHSLERRRDDIRRLMTRHEKMHAKKIVTGWIGRDGVRV